MAVSQNSGWTWLDNFSLGFRTVISPSARKPFFAAQTKHLNQSSQRSADQKHQPWSIFKPTGKPRESWPNHQNIFMIWTCHPICWLWSSGICLAMAAKCYADVELLWNPNPWGHVAHFNSGHLHPWISMKVQNRSSETDGFLPQNGQWLEGIDWSGKSCVSEGFMTCLIFHWSKHLHVQ